MSRFSGSREQQQAAGARATSHKGRRYSEALQRYLELEQREVGMTAHVEATSAQVPPTGRPGFKHGRRTGTLTHEHVVIDGRDVEVTEDDFGVAELHLK